MLHTCAKKMVNHICFASIVVKCTVRDLFYAVFVFMNAGPGFLILPLNRAV